MESSLRNGSDTMNKTKVSTLLGSTKKVFTSSITSTTTHGTKSRTTQGTRPKTGLDSKRKQLKVPIGKLLSIPEKLKRGAGSDAIIDDAEEKAARNTRVRPLPLLRPVVDPKLSTLTPTPFIGNDGGDDDDAQNKNKNKNDSQHESTAESLASLEGNLRLAVKKLHSVQTSGKTWLTNALTDVDSFGVGVLSRDQFTQALSQLTGIQISKKQARALCVVADANGKGDTVEIGKFVARITCGASRADNCVKKIPTLRGYPVKDDEFIGGKIAYPKSRSLVRAPTNFDVNAVDASMFPPDANLVLRHVFGYDGGSKCTSQNLFVTGDQTVVVFVAAAVGVVHDTVSKKQRHFLGHTGTITCLTMCDSSVTYKGVTYPPRTLCATGQTIARNQGQGGDTSWEGKENASGNTQSQCPFVAVWDVRTLQEITRVPLARDTQSVAAVAFSTDGNLLTTVGNDAHHTVQVWDWRVDDVDRVSNVGSVKKTKLGDLEKPILKKKPKGVHENGSPGSVFGLRFDPNTATKVTRFVTWGKKHVKVWTRYSENGPWVSRQMRFGKFGVMDVAFLPPVVAENKDVPGDGCDKKVTHKNCFSSIVTGHDDGSLLVWVSGVAVRQVNDAHVGGGGG